MGNAGTAAVAPRGSGVAGAPRVDAQPVAATYWKGRDLLELRGCGAGPLRAMLRAAAELPSPDECAPEPWRSRLAGRTVATLFFEDSTRTKTSFSIAARRLGADVADLTAGASSVNKGETLVDTALNVAAMGVAAIVVRARQSGAAELVARAVSCPVINAGDGRHEHPTQGLLDILTIAEAHGRVPGFDLSGLRVAIVGDVVSSRVARSGIAGLTTLGADVVCVGPPGLVHGGLRTLGCEIEHSLDAVIGAVDAVIVLRIQFERHGDAAAKGDGGKPEQGKSTAIASIREYRELYGMTTERAERMRPQAVLMHPGPMNRGLEIDGPAADGARSVILKQVANGVRVRMAALGLLTA